MTVETEIPAKTSPAIHTLVVLVYQQNGMYQQNGCTVRIVDLCTVFALIICGTNIFLGTRNDLKLIV